MGFLKLLQYQKNWLAPLVLWISIAVAALAVHISAEDWGGGGIVNWLRDELNSHPEFVPEFWSYLQSCLRLSGQLLVGAWLEVGELDKSLTSNAIIRYHVKLGQV